MKMAQLASAKARWVVRAVKPRVSPRSSMVIPSLMVKGRSGAELEYS